MATVKYYLNNAAADFGPPTTRGTWNDGSPLIEKKLTTTKDVAGAPASSGTQVGDGTANHKYMMMRFTSAALAADTWFAAGDAWSGAIACLESSTSMNAWLCVHAYVMIGDTDTVRGTLVSNYVDANEASASVDTCGEGCSGTISENVWGRAGDRVVLEVGMKCNTTNTSYTCTEYYGGSGADIADNGDGDALPGWIQFTYYATGTAHFWGTTVDGRIYSTSTTYATARSGGTLSVSTTPTGVYAGQGYTNPTYTVDQGFFYWDLSTYPAGTTVTGASILLECFEDSTVTDCVTEVRADDYGATLTSADFVPGDSLAGLTLLASLTSVGLSGGVKTFSSEAALPTAVTAAIGGALRVVVCSDRVRVGNTPTNNEYAGWYAYTAGGASKPKLVVTYNAAASGTNTQINIGDVWKTATAVQINIGDTWKPVTKVQVNIGDTWKTVF